MLHALLALAAVAAPPAADDPPAKALAAAIQAMADGHADQVLTLIEPALAAYDRQHAGERGRRLCTYGAAEIAAELAAARAAGEDPVAIGADWCDAQFMKGFALADLHRFAEARPVLERLVAMAPLHAHFLNELAYVYQQQRDWQLSNATYQRARAATAYSERGRAEAERTRAMRGMGYALIELGRWDEAEALFNECLAIDPNDANAKNELRYIAQQRRRPRA